MLTEASGKKLGVRAVLLRQDVCTPNKRHRLSAEEDAARKYRNEWPFFFEPKNFIIRAFSRVSTEQTSADSKLLTSRDVSFG